MTNDNEIKVLLTADAAQLQAGMEAGAASVQQSVDQMQATIAEDAAAFNAAVQAKIDAMMRLNAAFAGNLASAEGVTEAEAALDQAMAAGAITTAEQTAYLERLTAAEVESTVAVEANTAAITMNGQVGREVGIMIGELARGNYTRLEGSTVTLANRTGLLTSALEFIISPLGIATAAAAGLGVAAYEAAQDEEKLHDALINTGDASGYNSDQLRTMEAELVSTGATAGQAREAVLAVANSGNILGQNFKNAAQAAVDMAQLTGISIDKAVQAIGKLQEDPVKSIMKLNETMNFLTPTEAEEIKHLQDIGNTAGAAALAIATLTDAEEKRAKAQRDAGGGAESFTGKLKADLSGIYAGAKDLFGAGTLKQQLDDANKELASYSAQNPGSIHQDSNNQIVVDKSKLSQYQYQELNKLLEKRKEIEAQITAEDERQQKVSAQVADNKAKVNATLSAKNPEAKHGSASGDHGASQADMDAFNEQRLAHSMSLADEQKFWEAKKASAVAGTQEYRQAVRELLTIRSREASEAHTEASREASDARRSAQERIAAEREVEREKQRAAEQARQLSIENLKNAHDESLGEIANKRQQYQNEYSEGTISAQRLLQLEDNLAVQKLAIDLKYYQDKEKLDAGDLLAVAKDDAAIVKAKQDAQNKMQTNEKEFLANSEKQWNTYAKQIEGAMQSAVTGMLLQHQTLRQGLGNIALVIGEDFIKQAVMKPVDHFIQGEIAKTSAAIAGATQRALVEQTAAKESMAADAATGKSQITSAAATGAAKAYQAIVGIPIVGPILAPIAAGVAFAGIEAFSGNISSAAGGWSRVPMNGMMTQLHIDEKVLPAKEARGLDKLINGGGAAGGDVHIHAMDVRSFTDAARRNERAFADVMKKAHRNGRFGSR